MKKYMSYFMLLLAMTFMACSSDDDAPQTTDIDRSMLTGEWFSDESNTYLNMSYSSYKGVVYGELASFPIEGEVISGKWMYVPTSKILRMTIYYEKSQTKVETRDYKVLNINDNTLTLLDIQLNGEYTYHKVLDSHSLALGEEFTVSADGINPTSYTSISPMIAKVNSEGKVKACCTGTAFIFADSGNKSFFTRVEVAKRPTCYVNELFGTIDDVLARYGTPNWSGDSETPTKVAVYSESINDTRLKYIHYKYDPDTREVTEIVTRYVDAEGYESDVEELKALFIDIYSDGSVFGKEAYLVNNMYVIQPMTNGTDYVYYYSNMYYIMTHGYR